MPQVAIISPFNFPLEIPALQLMGNCHAVSVAGCLFLSLLPQGLIGSFLFFSRATGALYMGNKPLIKNAEKTSMVIEQFVRLLIAAGMPASDVDLLHCSGSVVSELLRKAPVRVSFVCFCAVL